jgi:hypothetical protein
MSTTTEHEEQKKGRRYLSKPDVMRRYAWISAISVDRAVEKKTIPAPIYVGRRPLWLEEELDARDERARESSAAFSPERKRAQALFLQRARQGRKFQRAQQNRRRTRASA